MLYYMEHLKFEFGEGTIIHLKYDNYYNINLISLVKKTKNNIYIYIFKI